MFQTMSFIMKEVLTFQFKLVLQHLQIPFLHIGLWWLLRVPQEVQEPQDLAEHLGQVELQDLAEHLVVQELLVLQELQEVLVHLVLQELQEVLVHLVLQELQEVLVHLVLQEQVVQGLILFKIQVYIKF